MDRKHGRRIAMSQKLPLVLLVALTVCMIIVAGGILAYAADLTVREEATLERFDFERQGMEGWQSVDGRWVIEEMPGAPRGKRVLVQRAVENFFNVIVAPSAPYTDVDVSVRFKPMAGRGDASGGLVFRCTAGHYYVVRANALESNFRLYYYDRGRHQLATATVEPPTLGQWHTLRVVVVGEHIPQMWGPVVLEQKT